MPKLHHLLSLCIFCVSLMVACNRASEVSEDNPAQSASSESCRLVQHEMGKTKVCGQLQKVAALRPHILDNILALGVQPIAYADSAESVINASVYTNPSEQISYLGHKFSLANIRVSSLAEGTCLQTRVNTAASIRGRLKD
ncbi:MAG: hypothetical protein AAFQ80_20280 [Cyanobacteria bacterium J06621_8]